ncbi:MAG: EF-P beta-lysylation protein EpmB [Gammaproteobacteria bacterium]|nr:MAG: EF-P beta-lysylation protein EpmB [Gammaproteobacteria bacterium]
MIPRTEHLENVPVWQTALAQAIGSVQELLDLLQIDPAMYHETPSNADFPLRVPHSFAARMQAGNINDPLLRQVLPLPAEEENSAGYLTDPLAEQGAMASPGLLHKYHGRVLLTVTGACAVHCRYCFRRHFPYSNANPLAAHREEVLKYLYSHREITEVILSGGDPLVLPDSRLRVLSAQLAAIPHIRTLRLHTRLPVVLPERVDEQLLGWIGNHPGRVVIVIHCNHPNEIDAGVAAGLKQLAHTGATLLNQSVLLKGINDRPDTLKDLSESLFAIGVLPYYLHQLDRVQGAAHFEVSDARASQLMQQLHATLPGYLVPRLVREIPGLPGKWPLWPAVIQARDAKIETSGD